AFNRNIVQDFFEKLDKVLKENEIPWENVYNMDEKGIQLGGGRKSNGHHFFFSRDGRQNYKIHGGTLELVTVIECISAVSSSIPPKFIFAGMTVDPESCDVHPNIL
ncbi:hypothetical protein SERLA73DRAFT_64001, partial [Serpula lacrymans var. lacrymans S7.3]